MIIGGVEKLMSLQSLGKFGYSAGCGFTRCGYSRCGSSARFGGVYRRIHTLQGIRLSRMRYYRPTNPQTVPQQARRALFADGVAEWQGFTPEEKAVYNVKARGRHMTGFNVYMHEYMTS